MIDPRLSLYGTTLAQQVNPLSPQSLVQQPGGIAQVPTGTVETTHEPSKDYKVVGNATRESMGAMDTAQQALLDAKDQQAKTDIAREQAQADMAKKKAEEAAKFEEQREKMRKAEEDRRGAEMAARAQSLAEYEKTAKVKSLFDDMSPARKFLSAIAVGAGQWAAIMGGGQNTAYQIFKDQEENYRKVQEDRIKAATQKVMNQTKSAEEARKYFDSSMEDLDKRQIAKLKVMDLQLAAIEKAQPEAASRAAAARAQIQIDYEKGKRDFVSGYDTSVRETGKTTQESSGDKSGGALANRKTEGEQKFALLGSSMKAELNAITKGPALTEKDLQGLQDNTLGATAADKKAESGPFGAFIVGVGRWADMIPRNRYDGLSQEKKIVVNAWDNAVEKYARILTGAGMPAEEARRMGLQNMPVAGDDAKSQKFKFDRLMREADFMMSLSNDAKAAIVKRLQEGETFDSLMPSQEAPQPAQPTGKVGSPNRVRGIPPAKQDSAISTADDYGAIKDAVVSKKTQLNQSEQSEMKEVLQVLKKDPNDPDAARYLKQLRQRKGI